MKVTRAYGKLTEIDHETITLYDEKDLTFKTFTYDQTKIDSQQSTTTPRCAQFWMATWL